MPHPIHKCTNTLYDYAIINFNTYFSLTYELKKKLESYLWVNLLGPCPCLIKKVLPGRGLTKIEKHWYTVFTHANISQAFYGLQFPMKFCDQNLLSRRCAWNHVWTKIIRIQDRIISSGGIWIIPVETVARYSSVWAAANERGEWRAYNSSNWADRRS